MEDFFYAGGLPAFGIVAAVLGVVNTMGSVGQPPAVLGGMIGSALVGTFLGILLAYAFAEPLGGLLEQKVEEAGKELQCIRLGQFNFHRSPSPLSQSAHATTPYGSPRGMSSQVDRAYPAQFFASAFYGLRESLSPLAQKTKSVVHASLLLQTASQATVRLVLLTR